MSAHKSFGTVSVYEIDLVVGGGVELGVHLKEPHLEQAPDGVIWLSEGFALFGQVTKVGPKYVEVSPVCYRGGPAMFQGVRLKLERGRNAPGKYRSATLKLEGLRLVIEARDGGHRTHPDDTICVGRRVHADEYERFGVEALGLTAA